MIVSKDNNKFAKGDFTPLDIFCDCTVPFVSDLFENPKDRFSDDAAHISFDFTMIHVIL